MCNRQFFEILSKNLEFVRAHFNDRNNSFHSAIRRWMIKQ